MRLVDIDATTQDTFFRCLHEEQPANPDIAAARRRFYERHRPHGLRAKVLIDDEERVVGLCQYIPIEHSPFEGCDLLTILCVWVHGYEHLVGNQQGRGYGRFILDQIEADARDSGFMGVAAWGKDFPNWNPASFYEHMGYHRVATQGQDVLMWRPFTADSLPPRFMELQPLATRADRITITAFASGWCGGGVDYCLQARAAASDLADVVDYVEVDTCDTEVMRAHGIGDGVFVDGDRFRADGPPFTADELRAEIRQRQARRAEPAPS